MVELPPGDYLICGCGKSESLPYCDGSHIRLSLSQQPKQLTVTKKTGLLWLCTCGKSKKSPHCDGSHNLL